MTRSRTGVGTVSIRATFLIHGAVQGTWASRIPGISDGLELTNGALGIALFLQVVGGLAALAWAGRLVRLHGAVLVTRVGLVSYVASLVAIGLAPSFGLLSAAMVLVGAAGAACDVAMNAQASAVEKSLDRPIMSGLHGAWSAGSLVSAGVAVAVATVGVGVRPHLVAVAVVLLAVAVPTLSGVRPVPVTPAAGRQRSGPAPAPLVRLGCLAALAMYAEGAGADWSAVYVHDVTGLAAGTAAVGYAGFAAAMVAGRFVGDSIVRAVGPVPTARTAATVSVIGSVVVITAVAAPMAVAGFVLQGVGLSVLVPLLLSAAGRHGGDHGAGSAIATVSAIGYVGWLVAPMLVGQLAELASLRAAFATVAVAGVVLAFAAGAVAQRTTTPKKEGCAVEG